MSRPQCSVAGRADRLTPVTLKLVAGMGTCLAQSTQVIFGEYIEAATREKAGGRTKTRPRKTRRENMVARDLGRKVKDDELDRARRMCK